jgi:hypothetical protein
MLINFHANTLGVLLKNFLKAFLICLTVWWPTSNLKIAGFIIAGWDGSMFPNRGAARAAVASCSVAGSGPIRRWCSRLTKMHTTNTHLSEWTYAPYDCGVSIDKCILWFTLNCLSWTSYIWGQRYVVTRWWGCHIYHAQLLIFPVVARYCTSSWHLIQCACWARLQWRYWGCLAAWLTLAWLESRARLAQAYVIQCN